MFALLWRKQMETEATVGVVFVLIVLLSFLLSVDDCLDLKTGHLSYCISDLT